MVGQDAIAINLYILCYENVVDTAGGVVLRVEAVECSCRSKTYLSTLVGILQNATLDQYCVRIARLRYIEIAHKDCRLALAVLLNPLRNQLRTLDAGNSTTVIEVGREEIEASLVAIALEVAPGADARILGIPTLRWLVRSLREPEGLRSSKVIQFISLSLLQ